MRRQPEKGGAMFVTMIIITSLLSAAAVLVSMQLASSRSTDLTRSGMTGEYCAEVGVERASRVVINNYTAWAASLCTATSESACTPGSAADEKPIFATVDHDVDGDGIPDVLFYLRDDDDDNGVQNYGSDNNLQIYVVATCIKYPDTPRQVKELVTYGGTGTCYNMQLGNCQGNGNRN